MHCLQAQQRVTVRADKALPVQADGDIIGEESIEVKIAPQALNIIVPPED
jgi:diacylglycerol kinase family enzyme